MSREYHRDPNGFGLGAASLPPQYRQRESDAAALCRALLSQEAARAEGAPAFNVIAARIEKHPSPLTVASWPPAKSVRIAGALALSQLRIVPHAVLAAALVMAALAVCAAYLASASFVGIDPTWLFSMLLLAGAALTVSLALSAERSDSVALAMPVGPQAVVLARLAAVLCIDAIAGVGSCSIAALLGLPPDPAGIVSLWLGPLAVVSGASAFVAVWTGSAWAGSIVGIACAPLVAPVAQAISGLEAFPLAVAVQGVLGPAGIAILGLALLAATVCTARKALTKRMQTA
ncbi:hypothetical protein [Raoultibacter phocaeensis]|uniref:hypothetical protein n=1 Tax=Raoultibacter phocaeensis TaxID=2479841 RepID=UPI0011198BFC|nr:hypothetical protein [Raoultibacter phocaeensis]